jgi:GT2 family glycosyltransferase
MSFVPQPTGVPSHFTTASVIELDLAHPLRALAATDDARDILVVVRLCGNPVGMVVCPARVATDPDALAAAIETALGEAIAAEARSHGLTAMPGITAAGLVHHECPIRAAHDHVTRTGPAVSVVVCTRERADSLRRCLDSVRASDYHRFEIVVVDNAPLTDATELLCADMSGRGAGTISYVREERAGLSWARNAGIEAAAHDLVAFVDDDEQVDAGWLAALAHEFELDSTVGCISGVVLPAELETHAQVQFEQFGGHSKGRGFRRVVFDREYVRTRQSAMYPLPAFGVGANMAFRRAALADIGRFNVALGAGTSTHGGEDTYAFSELLLAGWSMVYAPAAVTWHYHRVDGEALERQLAGYGVGLGAYYTALVLRNPLRLATLARLAPQALRDLRDPHGTRNAPLADLQEDVARGNVRTMLRGPVEYARARRRARHQARAPVANHR